MNNNEDAEQQLIPFLRNLADSIESKELIPRQLKSIGEFFMSYKFQEQVAEDEKNIDNNDNNFSKEELIKFLSLGWYVYQIILEDKTLD
jgi:hypothetical protein